MHTPILANELLSAFANPKRGFFNYQDHKYSRFQIRSFQTTLATSQKFVVSDNLLEHTAKASYVTPSTLLDVLKRAIPPFNSMWVEWNETLRTKILRDHLISLVGQDKVEELSEGLPPRVGYLIKNINDKFLYHCFFKLDPERVDWQYKNGELERASYKEKRNQFFCPEMCFHINNERELTYADDLYLSQVSHAPISSEEHYWKDTNMQGMLALGFSYGMLHKDKLYKDKTLINSLAERDYDALTAYPYNSATTPDISKHIKWVQSGSTAWLVPKSTWERKINMNDVKRFQQSIHSLEGAPRFLISLLGLLNYDFIVQESVTPPKKINHISFGRNTPKSEYKVLEITLPKPRGKRVYEKIFTGQGSPKKEHWRRGHWRVLRTKDGKLKKRVWIDQMKCGNPKLGSIIKDYVLKEN